MSNTLTPGEELRLQAQVLGGGYTVADLMAEWQSQLDLARSPQSGVNGALGAVLTGAENTIYEESDTKPWAFLGGKIDWTGSTWATGESVTLRVYVKVKSGGTYHLLYAPAAIVALPNPVVMKTIDPAIAPPPIYNVYGLKITLEQTVVGAGYFSLDCEFFDQKRGS